MSGYKRIESYRTWLNGKNVRYCKALLSAVRAILFLFSAAFFYSRQI